MNANGQGTYTPINQWKREYELYHQLLKIPFFARYRKWKCFKLWKNTVLHTKITIAKKNLTKNAFILHNTLRSSLLQLNKFNVNIVLNKRLIGFEEEKTLELNEFVKDQKHFVERTVSVVIRPWEEYTREIVEKAVQKCLSDDGFPLETENQEPRKLTFTEQAARRSECKRLSRFVKLADYMMVSTLQFLVITSVQDLLKSTFRGCQDSDVVIDEAGGGTVLINEHGVVKPTSAGAKQQDLDQPDDLGNDSTGVQVGGIVVGKQVGTQNLLQCGFDGFSDILSKIVGAGIIKPNLIEVIEEEGPLIVDGDDDNSPEVKQAKKNEEVHKWKSSNEKTKIFVPLLRTELLMDNDNAKFYFASSLQDYLATVDILLKVYLSTVEQVGQLTYTIKALDASSSSGGSYSAIRGIDDPEFGDGPQVGSIILEGGYFKELCGRIRGVFVGMFGNASAWVKNLDELQIMWLENQSFNGLQSLKEQVGDLAYLLATAPENNEGGVAAIIAAARTAKLDAEESQNEIQEKEEEFDVLKYGTTASKNEDGLIISSLATFFDTSLQKFANQKATMNAIPTRCIINNLLIDSTNLKSILVPSPERCFNEVACLLPGLARNKNELLLTEVQTWVRILNSPSSNVESFVEYLSWVEKSKISMISILTNSSKNIGFSG